MTTTTTDTATNPLAARLARAQARAETAKGVLGKDERDEIAMRDEIAKHEDAERVANREARQLVIARALDKSRERLPGVALDTIDLEDAAPGAGAYVLRAAPSAEFVEWQARMSDTPDAKTRDRLTRNLAMAEVVAWIQVEADDEGPPRYRVRMNLDDEKKGTAAELHNLWTQRCPAAATSINNTAVELAGAAAARRKS